MNPDFSPEAALERLVQAALPHVAFDGWSPATLRAAAVDSGLADGLVAALAPRGALDLAIAAHRLGDAAMGQALAGEDLTALRFRDRITNAVRLRLESAGSRDVLRRSAAFFALPGHAVEGAALVWGTADAVWRALGDTSQDINWYSKRASLSAVYSATFLYWLGDTSPGATLTWEFLDRRIENVMAFEKAKAGFTASPLGKALAAPLGLLGRVKAPQARRDLPGHQDRP